MYGGSHQQHNRSSRLRAVAASFSPSMQQQQQQPSAVRGGDVAVPSFSSSSIAASSSHSSSSRSSSSSSSHLSLLERADMDKYERFEAWLRDNGARFEMLELREYDCSSPASDSMVDCEEKKEPAGPSGSVDDDDLNARLLVPRIGGALIDATGAAGSGSTNCLFDCGNGSVVEESEMRGVHARVHVPPNTVCMSIPRCCLITVEMGQATPIGQAILNADLDLDAPKHIFLMVYILWDRKVHGASSFFHPYYEILPKSLSNMPIFWNDDELALLQGSYLLHQIRDRDAAITEDYHSICQIAPSLAQICTLEEFKWARMCVCSRNFGLQIDGHRTSAMVPHADMLNHYRPRETKWTFDEERQAFTITTLQHIPAGAQVYDSYGQKCNHRFLLNYGFAVEDNNELDGFCPNEVALELTIPADDALFAERRDFWIHGEQIVSSGASAGSATASAQTGVHRMQPTQTPSTAAANNNNSKTTVTASFFPPAGESMIGSFFSSSSSSASSSATQTSGYRPVATTDADVIQQQCLLKRVRVCVANNENTRLLFSLLRVLACNAEELRSFIIGTTTSSSNVPARFNNHHGSNNNSGEGSSHMFYQMHYSGKTNNSDAGSRISRSMFGLPDANRSVSSSVAAPVSSASIFASSPFTSSPAAVASPSMPTPSYHRSCRDIRHPLSFRNERAAMLILLQIVRRHLAVYSTTLSQDVLDLMDLQQYPRFSNRRHAKVQVRGEKEVLHHYAAWARTALEVMDVIEEELHQEQTRFKNCKIGNKNSSTVDSGVEVQLVQVSTTPGDAATTTTTMTTTMDEQVEDDNTNGGDEYEEADADTESRMVGYEELIRRMEEEVDSSIHHTVYRYCADVLGMLRREEWKRLRRQQQQQQLQGSSGGGHGALPIPARRMMHPFSTNQQPYHPGYM